MESFVGRFRELSLIYEVLEKPSASVMVYGKPKVGKTTLIRHALKKSRDPVAYYECLKSTLSDNINGFVNELVHQEAIPAGLSFATFPDVFRYVNHSVIESPSMRKESCLGNKMVE